MKLLDWMQHNFRQTNKETPIEIAPRKSCSCLTGQPSLDDLQHYPKPHYYAKASSKKEREGQFRKSFTCVETARRDDEQAEEEESAAGFSELFHEFLSMRTVATETVTNELATPKFATNVENNVVNKTEAKENEPKPIDVNNENGAVVCPLQDYLFGSVSELPETLTVKKEREHRTTLGRLFQITKMVEEATGVENNSTEKLKEKETEKSAVYMMKKLLKGRTLNSSFKHSTADKKSRKILRDEPKSEDYYATKENFTEEHKNRNQMLFQDIILFPKVDTSKNGANGMPQSRCCMGDSDGNRECWITSDADYLVLEL